jgi:hypothetical protein
MQTDPELLEFTAQCIEQFGGIAEQHDEQLTAVLPKPLRQSLHLPEEVQLGDEARPLLYGSPVLDQLIHLATAEVPLVMGRIEVPYLKKAGFEQQLSQDFVFTNARLHVSNRAEARTTYMALTCKYIALSDERKEGLVEVSVQENSGAVIADFEHLWSDQAVQFYQQSSVPPHFPTHLEHTVRNVLQEAHVRADRQLVDFTESMKRRLRRDVKNTQEYYQALENEMEASLSNPNLGDTQRQERLAKIEDLPHEMHQKINDLQHKYAIQLSLRGCAVIRMLVDVVKIMVEIRHKKFQRTEHLIWNPVTGRFDPLVCEQCARTIREIHFLPKNAVLQIVCADCAQKK